MSNVASIPNFYNYDNWNAYMSSLWSLLIDFCGLGIKSTVVEIAPGATPKITLALRKLNFKGTYFIIEPHPAAAISIYKKTREILPEANVHLIKENFSDAIIDCNVDYLFANHSFDDFISAYAANDKASSDILFQDITKVDRPNALELQTKIWKYLSSDFIFLNKIKYNVRMDFQSFVQRINPKHIIISQYPSAACARNGLQIINKEALDLFQNLKFTNYNKINGSIVQDLLNKNEDYGLWWIKDMLNAQVWGIYEKK